MANHKYDIFISYRHDGGAQYARILQLELEKRGYKVFLDYEELTDGIFGYNIKEAIHEAPIFMMVLSAHYLDRCKYEGDWVREEIMLASTQQKHFIPINPDNSFDGIPADTPKEIKHVVGSHQHSDVNFGQLLGASIDKMVKNRVYPHIGKHKQVKWGKIALMSLLGFVLIVGIVAMFLSRKDSSEKLAELRSVAEEYAKPIETICKQPINWSEDITAEQLRGICSILYNMVEVQGGLFLQGAIPDTDGNYNNLVCQELETPTISREVESFFIGKYEVTTAQWHRIMEGTYEEEDSLLPIANISYSECVAFTKKLSDLTGLNFRLPTEAEWEYAARGGIEADGTLFAGSDNADDVAWYANNSGGKAHVCDATNSPMYPNGLGIYDMSGNLCEWCCTSFQPYKADVAVPDTTSMVTRGGCFNCDLYELTVYHRDPKNPMAKDETIGLRLVIGNE